MGNMLRDKALRLLMLKQIERPQRAIGDARRVFNRRSTTRQGDIGEVHEPLVRLQVGKQHLTTPNGTVQAIACAIEGEAAHRAFQVVLTHNGKDMSMVMLNARHRHPLA